MHVDDRLRHAVSSTRFASATASSPGISTPAFSPLATTN